MISTLLSVHLIGAALFAGSLLATAGILIGNKRTWYSRSAIVIGSLTALEIVTGTTMSIMVNDGLIETCAKAGIYLALAGVTEYILLRRLDYRPAWLTR